MVRLAFAALILAASGVMARADEELVLALVGPGQAGPEKLCVIGKTDGAFWAVEQLMTNSFPAPRVTLEPFEGREDRFDRLAALLRSELLATPDWQTEAPTAPYLHLALVSGGDGARIDAYLPGQGVPADVAGLFGELGRYGMDCVPPTLR